MFVDIHVIQPLPPSCVNRDDTGAPKSCVYGGEERARISSQCFKAAMRKDFYKYFGKDAEKGVRTKFTVDLIKDEIKKIDSTIDEESASQMAAMALLMAIQDKKSVKESLKKFKENELDLEKDIPDVLLYITPGQVKSLASLAVKEEGDQEAYKEAVRLSPSYDQILFGRMVATDPTLSYDAACQVAHSFTTHPVNLEYDFFTAMDDVKVASGQQGAGHLDMSQYTSGVFYRYANVNVDELIHWFGERSADVVKAFIESFIFSMPTGKQNTFASRTIPSAVYVAIRDDQPISFAGAFETAITGNTGYSEKSVERLAEYANTAYQFFAKEPKVAFTCGKGLESLTEPIPINELTEDVKKDILAEIK